MSILVSTLGCFNEAAAVLGAEGRDGIVPLAGAGLGTLKDPRIDPFLLRTEPRKEFPLLPWKLPLKEPRPFLKELGLTKPPTPIPAPIPTAQNKYIN